MRFKEKKENPINNQEKAFKYLVQDKGMNPNVAAGLLGNLMQESHMLENTWTEGKVDDVGSMGIMQWHGGRLDNLYDFYKGMNPDYKEGETIPLDRQLDFILHEAKTGGGDRWLKKQYQKVEGAKNPKEAALAFSDFVVRPHKDYAHNDKRVQYAQNLVQDYGDKYKQGYDYFNDPKDIMMGDRKEQARIALDKKKSEYNDFVQSQVDPSLNRFTRPEEEEENKRLASK